VEIPLLSRASADSPAPPLDNQLGGTPARIKGAGSSAGPRLAGPAGFGWFLGRLARRLRAAVRASSRRDSRAVGERAGAGVWARLRRQRDRAGCARLKRGACCVGAIACMVGARKQLSRRDAATLIGSAVG
jgi:hypothetical protein